METSDEPAVTDRQWLYQVIARWAARESGRLINISKSAERIMPNNEDNED